MHMGVETEFGILHGWDRTKARQILAEALKTQAHIACVGEGAFLANGARVYVDMGWHNEYSTPESPDPASLVIHELAGRRLMAESAAAAKLSLLCSNVDPLSGNAWGSHENYGCTRPFTNDDNARLAAHLVTRILYTGTGGLDPTASGIRLVLSPRACSLQATLSAQGMPIRSLIFIKPNHHGAGYRLHLTGGEGLLSHRALYLRYATTALVAACLDAHLPIGPGPFAQSPLYALRRINRDSSLTTRIRMADGRTMTALDIQQCLLDGVAAHREALPAWAPTAIARWQAVLDGLRNADPAVARQLDWLVFQRAYRNLAKDVPPTKPTRRRRLRPGPGSPRPRTATTSPTQPPLAGLRAAAAELYLRLHILGQDSLHAYLDQQGWLDHRLPEITDDAIHAAMRAPPPGRAANRGTLIQRHAADPTMRMEWGLLHHPPQCRQITIPDDPAWEGAEPWTPVADRPSWVRRLGRPPEPEPCVSREYALRLLLQKEYSEAARIYDELLQRGFERPSTYTHLARLHLITGDNDKAGEALTQAWNLRSAAPKYVLARILALLRGADPLPFLQPLKHVLLNTNVQMPWTIQPLMENLQPRLPPDSLALVQALTATLHNRDNHDALNAIPAWQAIPISPEPPPL